MIEVEAYRALAERAALDRPIAVVEAPDAWYLKGGLTPEALTVLIGSHFSSARRRGKLLTLETSGPEGGPGPVLGLRFGMSGRLLVDGTPGVAELRYASNEPLERYDRFGVTFADGGHLRVRILVGWVASSLTLARRLWATTLPLSLPPSWAAPWPGAVRLSRLGSWTRLGWPVSAT